MTVGENIRRIRKEKGLTQKELGNLCNLADSAIRRYELGGANPKLETIEKIAKALDVKIVDLVDSIYIPDYVKTEEFAEMERYSNAYNAVISILKAIYGDVTEQEYNYDHADRPGYGTVHYYTVVNGQHKFILHPEDIRTLLNYAETSFPFIVDSLKDTRSEEDIIKELCEKNEQVMKELLDDSIKATRIIDYGEE